MANTIQAERTTIEVRRTIRASRERVFQAFTNPDEVARWSAPAPLTVASAEIDLRVGGRYRIALRRPDGGGDVATGEYREVSPPSRLVYTWSWEDKPVKDSLVTVEFEARGAATEVILRHELLPNAESGKRHTDGWVGCFDKLVELF